MPRSPPVRAAAPFNSATPAAILYHENVRRRLPPCTYNPSAASALLSSLLNGGQSTTTVTCLFGLPVTAAIVSSTGVEFLVVDSTATLATLTTVITTFSESSSSLTSAAAGATLGSGSQASSTATSSTASTASDSFPTGNSTLTSHSSVIQSQNTNTRSYSTSSTLSGSGSSTPLGPSNSITSPSPSPSGPVPLTQHQTPTSINPGAIAGGILAALIFLICFILILQRRKHKQAQKNDPSLIPDVFTTTHNDTGETGHDHTTDHDNRSLGSPLWSHQALIASVHSTPATSALSTPLPTPAPAPASISMDPSPSPSPSNNSLPVSVAQWAAAELPQQYEILMRENGEFWEEIEQLREENERLRVGAAATVGVAL